MKKLKYFGICLLVAPFLTACSEAKDEAYYKAHMDEAKEKLSTCQAEAAKVFMEKGKEASEKFFYSDKECKASYKVVENN